MRLRARHLFAVVLIAVAAGALANAAGGTGTASFTAVDFEWTVTGGSGKTVTINAGESVQFSYPSGSNAHNADFGATSPSLCTQTAGASSGIVPPLPHSPTGPGWSGSCTFNTPGTYNFQCDRHPSMTGTVVVLAVGEPTASTEAATSVGETSATLKGTVNPNGHPTTYFFKYGTTPSYGSETSISSPITAETPVSVSVTGLAVGTTYHFRLVAKNEKGTVEGADQIFTTASPPGPPTATTEQAAALSETTATLKGMVNPDGETTRYFFKWGTDTSYGHSSNEVTLGSTDHAGHSVSAALEGLAPNTTYHFRLVAKNGSGTVEGADNTFTTSSKSEPPAKEPSKEPPAKEPTPTPTPTPTPSPISPQPEIAPLVPPLVEGSLKLTAPRHSSSVRGSIEVSKSGAGGRLEIDLIAKSASLATVRHKKSTSTVVGRLVRSSVSAGKVSFSISLNARAKSALHRHHKLALTVKITLTPPSGAPEVITRSLVLHA